MLASALVWCDLPYSAVCNSGKRVGESFRAVQDVREAVLSPNLSRPVCLTSPSPSRTHTHTHIHTHIHAHIPHPSPLRAPVHFCAVFVYGVPRVQGGVPEIRIAVLHRWHRPGGRGTHRHDDLPGAGSTGTPSSSARGGGICVCVLEGNGGCAPCAHHGVVAAGVCGCGSRT